MRLTILAQSLDHIYKNLDYFNNLTVFSEED